MSEILFLLKKLITALILPPTSALLISILGLLLLKRRPRLGRTLAWAGVAILLLFSMSFISRALSQAVAVDSQLQSDRARSARAIVILGGGEHTASEYGGHTVSAASLERVQYGAKLAKDLGLPVLVTGGSVFGGPPEAHLMAQALRNSFGIEAKWVEDRSRDTHQNAVYSAPMLKSAGIDTVLLVTHDIHERRGIAEFTAVGIDAVAAPVTSAATQGAFNLADVLPNAGALSASGNALHEILGNLAAAR